MVVVVVVVVGRKARLRSEFGWEVVEYLGIVRVQRLECMQLYDTSCIDLADNKDPKNNGGSKKSREKIHTQNATIFGYQDKRLR